METSSDVSAASSSSFAVAIAAAESGLEINESFILISEYSIFQTEYNKDRAQFQQQNPGLSVFVTYFS